MLEQIEKIRAEAGAAIEGAQSSAELEELRVHHLGRKAELTTILRGIAELPPEERGAVGGAANRARKELEDLLQLSAERLDSSELEAKLVTDRIDVTLPGAPPRRTGHPHLFELGGPGGGGDRGLPFGSQRGDAVGGAHGRLILVS